MKSRYAFRPKALRLLTAAFAMTCMAGAAGATTITFASFGETSSNVQEWAVSESMGPSISTVTASGNVMFTFSGITGLPFSGAEAAILTLTATSTQIGNCGTNCAGGTSLTQHGYTGSFTIIDNGVDAGANLLSGTFTGTVANPSATGAQFSTTNLGGSSASFDASATPTNLGQLVLTSQFVTFSPATTLEDASFALSSVNPSVFDTGLIQPTTGVYQAFFGAIAGASGVGTFSSDVVPAATPEPATFGLIGGGLLGFGLWRRKKALASVKI